MILYNSDSWSCVLLLRLSGSVLPHAFSWGISSTLFAAAVHLILIPRAASFGFHDNDSDGVLDFVQQMEGVPVVWAGFTAALGSLLAFRNSSAYRRFWEGASLVYMVRGEWFNAVSSLMSFCSTETHLQMEVSHFQQLLVRLISLLHCSALQHVCEIAEDSLEVLDVSGIDAEYLEFLDSVHDRCEMLIQWVQRLVVEAHRKQVLDISPPILSRCFQELSRGIVNLNNVRKIKDIPFPYPYNQLVIWMLLLHWLITPLLAGLFIHSSWWAMIVTFLTQSSLWAVNFIAGQMDQPFGEDANDLPMAEMQRDFNKSLLALLELRAQSVPPFENDALVGTESQQPQITKAPSSMFREARKAKKRRSGNRRVSSASTPSAGFSDTSFPSDCSESSESSVISVTSSGEVDVIIWKDENVAAGEGNHVDPREEAKEGQEVKVSLSHALAANAKFSILSDGSGNPGLRTIPKSRRTSRLSASKEKRGMQDIADAASENLTSTNGNARIIGKSSSAETDSLAISSLDLAKAMNSQDGTRWGQRELSASSQAPVPAVSSNPLSFKGRKIFNPENTFVNLFIPKKKRLSQPGLIGFRQTSNSTAVAPQHFRKSGTARV